MDGWFGSLDIFVLIILNLCTAKQAETVMAAYRPWFDDMKMERVMGDWALLVGTRNDQPEV